MTKKAKPIDIKKIYVKGYGERTNPLHLGIDLLEKVLVYKKCQTSRDNPTLLVTLELSAGAQIIFGSANKTLKFNPRYFIQSLIRGEATFGKCRTAEAKVVSIKKIVCSHGKFSTSPEPVKTAYSMHDSSFRYVVGKTVKAPLDENEFEDCLSGIHFFCTKEEAFNY